MYLVSVQYVGVSCQNARGGELREALPSSLPLSLDGCTILGSKASLRVGVEIIVGVRGVQGGHRNKLVGIVVEVWVNALEMLSKTGFTPQPATTAGYRAGLVHERCSRVSRDVVSSCWFWTGWGICGYLYT